MPTFSFVDLVQLLLAGWQEGHLAPKSFCLTTPEKAINISD